MPPAALDAIRVEFPDAVVSTGFVEYLPRTDQTLHHFKLEIVGQDRSVGTCLDRDLVVIDCEAAIQAESEARHLAVGLMDDVLAAWVAEADDSASGVVGLFVRVDEADLPSLDRALLEVASRGDAERLDEEHLALTSAALRDAKRSVLDELTAGGHEIVYSSPLSPLVFVRLGRDDILRLAWDTERFTHLTLETLGIRHASIVGTESAGLKRFHQQSIYGSGYKIAVVEPGEVYFANPFIPSPAVRREDKEHNPAGSLFLKDERHATFVAGIASSNYLFWLVGAPLAQVISANWASTGFPPSEVCAAMDWAIAIDFYMRILNNSWACEYDSQWLCGTAVAYHMDFLANTYYRTFTKASGNGAAYGYESTCEAYSQICVGAYDDKNTTPYTNPWSPPAWHVFDDEWASFSSYVNPAWSGDRELPHVTAPGVGIGATREDDAVPSDWFCTQAELDACFPSFCCRGLPAPPAETVSNGTSFSTPVVSALAAMLMEQAGSIHYLWYFPQLLRAIVLASATNDVDCLSLGYWPNFCPTSVMRKSDRDGYGGINGEDAFNLLYSGNVFKPYLNKVPDGSDAYTITRYIPAGQTIRAALSWLEDVQWIRNNGNYLKNDFDLRLFNPAGQLVSTSSSIRDNNEVIEYNTTISGNYTFKVRNYKWRNPANGVYVGLAILWFSSTYNNHPR